ncbi:MAG: PQQ-dependent sugar dehydrogenase [Bacteroidetes bacterium]|nr:PQQ-dependent sugar dehydrogenase [Bacteroidota bacterium]
MKNIIILLALFACALSVYGQNPNVQLVDAFPNLSFNKPLHFTNMGDSRNFVLQQDGKIIVFQNDSNVTTAKVFLDISNKISASSGEEGLLGLAFHPNYASNGYFYVNYTAPSPLHTVIARYKVKTSDPDKADSLSEYKLLEINQPFTNHNGGTVMFGLDGYLYIGMGDGGSSGDPNNNAQNLQVLLGKMLRIDVNDTTATRRYLIPPTNPFYNNPTAGKEELYAWGLRNPWKFTQDATTGLIYVGDVGQSAWEEIDILQNGKNYGWRQMEGFACYNPSTGCDTSGKTLPIKVYGHTSGSCSITGGYVYRGARRPELRGAYIYGDYCSGFIWMLRYNNGTVSSDSLLTQRSISLGAIGVDKNNEMYFLQTSAGGKIYRFNRSPLAGIINNQSYEADNFTLKQNYPNPFNPSTKIEFSVPQRSAVRLSVYDASGRLTRTLVNTYLQKGNYEFEWNGTDDYGKQLSSGIYFYKMSSEGFTETRKMILLK